VAQQIGDIPEITVYVSSIKNNGTQKTEKIIKEFNKALNIKHIVHKNVNEIISRENVRNRQVKESNSEWIFFGDCDHVFPDNFFLLLKQKLSYPRYKNLNGILYSPWRFTTEEIATQKIMHDKSIYIDNAYDRAMLIPMINKSIVKIAGGAMQLVRRDLLNGYYTDTHKQTKRGCIEFDSDKYFRRRFSEGPGILRLPRMIHLNHQRRQSITDGKAIQQ
jgi:hypothetical protein